MRGEIEARDTKRVAHFEGRFLPQLVAHTHAFRQWAVEWHPCSTLTLPPPQALVYAAGAGVLLPGHEHLYHPAEVAVDPDRNRTACPPVGPAGPRGRWSGGGKGGARTQACAPRL